MRSIGKKNIKRLKQIVAEEIKKRTDRFGQVYWYGLEEEVIKRCPAEWWDIWECADQEIRRIVDDEIFGYVSK